MLNAYTAGVASVVPEDGVTQADVDAAVALVVPEDGVTQADVEAAATAAYNAGVASGVASVVPEDGVTQADVDAAVALVVPEDGVTQANVDAAVKTLQAEKEALQAQLQEKQDAINGACSTLSMRGYRRKP